MSLLCVLFELVCYSTLRVHHFKKNHSIHTCFKDISRISELGNGIKIKNHTVHKQHLVKERKKKRRNPRMLIQVSLAC